MPSTERNFSAGTTAKDCLLKYKRKGKGRLLAVASIFRDLASLQAEVKMEREATWRAG